jgi:hypothetical protein
MENIQPKADPDEDQPSRPVNPLFEFWIAQQDHWWDLCGTTPHVAVREIEDYMRALRVGEFNPLSGSGMI